MASSKKGFTLLEMIFVLLIIVIIFTIVTTTFNQLGRSQSIDSDGKLVLSLLTQARSQTLSSQNSSQYGVHFASTTLTLFTGTSYNPADAANQIYYLNPSDILKVTLAGGGTDVVFARLTGETSQNGTVTLSLPSASSTKTVVIYKTGLAE